MKLMINEDLDTVKSTLHNTHIIRKVDSSGTINIPKSIRESMGIEANDEVYLYVDNTNNTIGRTDGSSDLQGRLYWANRPCGSRYHYL